MRRAIPFGLILLLLAACSSQTDSGNENGYAALEGRWFPTSDSGSNLVITQACCGARSRVTGTLKWNGADIPLGPASTIVDYTVVLPDSASGPTHILAMNLELNPETDEALCRLEGLVESDGTGFSGSRPLSISSLRLVRWVVVPSGCEPMGDSLEWVKAR